MATTVLYQTSDGAMLGYTTLDPPGPNQIPDPLPTGMATKSVNGDPGQPPAGFLLVWNTSTLVFDQVALPRASLSPREFWDLFTPTEREDIGDLARNGTAAQQKKIRAFKEYAGYDGIRLNAQYVIDSVNLMESSGVIAAGRAAVILNG